jgi:hypothetical protein
MTLSLEMSPTVQCEKVLKGILEYNEKQRIFPSESKIIKRILQRSNEMAPVYVDMVEKNLATEEHILNVFTALLGTTSLWLDGYLQKARESRERLSNLNEEIAVMALSLAELMQERTELSNSSGYWSNSRYHIVDFIHRASRGNGFYSTKLEAPLKQLTYDFDCKYWPPIESIMREVAEDSDTAEVIPDNQVVEAATRTSRLSKADFLRALNEQIDDYKAGRDNSIPQAFRFSDNSLATLLNCLLDLPANEMVDGDYIRRFRQRERERVPTAST